MTLNYDEMMALCDAKQEFRAKEETVGGVPVVIFSYMVSMKDTFDSEFAKEFRGTVFRKDTKECICRPLVKFFNIGEKEETLLENIDLSYAKYHVKHDGSMATPVLIDGKIYWKTKNSFYSDVALKIQNFYDGGGLEQFDDRMLRKICRHYTPIFEYVAPHNRIVLEYQKEELIYLGFRDIESGVYLPNVEHKEDVEYNDVFKMNDVEGFVIHLNSGQIVKAKTEWYLERHKIVTDFNPKAIIKATQDGTIDDMIAVVAQLGFRDRVKQIEELRDMTVQSLLKTSQLINVYAKFLAPYKSDRKEFAQMVNEKIPKEYRGFMFMGLDGKDIKEKLDKFVFDAVYLGYRNELEVDE